MGGRGGGGGGGGGGWGGGKVGTIIPLLEYICISISTNFFDPLEICDGPFALLTATPEINPGTEIERRVRETYMPTVFTSEHEGIGRKEHK